MVRRVGLLLTAVLLLAGAGVRARAAGEGRIRICLNAGTEQCDPGEVTLWKVAYAAGQDYELKESFGGGLIRCDDVHSPDLALWLKEAAGEDGQQRRLDADGCADFSNLGQGLYLIAQTDPGDGKYLFAPFLIPLPYEGQWEVQANPKTQRLLTESPKTGEHPAPILAAMGLILSGMGLAACVEKLRKK